MQCQKVRSPLAVRPNVDRNVMNSPIPPLKPLDLDPIDIGWLAGLLEGEGYFSYSWNAKKHLRVIVRCKLTDKDVVESIRRITGMGSLSFQDRKDGIRQISYEWNSGNRLWLRRLLYTLRPYMHSRRRKRIDEVLQAIEHALKYSPSER